MLSSPIIEWISNTNLIGIIWGIILVFGAARQEKNTPIHPRNSVKERLFAIWWIIMFIYSIFHYFEGGSPLYILLEIFICIASRLKMMKEQWKNDMRTLWFLGASLITISYLINQTEQIIRFISWFIIVSLWYISKGGTTNRNAALTIWWLLISIFSYLEMSWIFFAVNVFFTFFAAHYRKKLYIEKHLWKKND